MASIRLFTLLAVLLVLSAASAALPPELEESPAAGEYRLALPLVSREIFPGDENYAAAAALIGVQALPAGFTAVAAAGVSATSPLGDLCPVDTTAGRTGAAAAAFARAIPPGAAATAVLIFETPALALAAAQQHAAALNCLANSAVGSQILGVTLSAVQLVPIPLAGIGGFAAGARLQAQAGTIIPVGVTLDAVYVASGRFLFAFARVQAGPSFPAGETVAAAQAGAALLAFR